MGQGNIGERGNYCWLATSVDSSSERKFDRAQLSQARTQELDLGRKKVSGEAGRLGGSACPFKDRRRGNGEANGLVSSQGGPTRVLMTQTRPRRVCWSFYRPGQPSGIAQGWHTAPVTVTLWAGQRLCKAVRAQRLFDRASNIYLFIQSRIIVSAVVVVALAKPPTMVTTLTWGLCKLQRSSPHSASPGTPPDTARQARSICWYLYCRLWQSY